MVSQNLWHKPLFHTNLPTNLHIPISKLRHESATENHQDLPRPYTLPANSSCRRGHHRQCLLDPLPHLQRKDLLTSRGAGEEMARCQGRVDNPLAHDLHLRLPAINRLQHNCQHCRLCLRLPQWLVHRRICNSSRLVSLIHRLQDGTFELRTQARWQGQAVRGSGPHLEARWPQDLVHD